MHRVTAGLLMPCLLRQLRKLVPPFAVSVMQSVIAQVALAHRAYMRDGVAATIQERERMTAALRLHPTWKVVPSKANFLHVGTPDAVDSFNSLLAKGVLVRRQDSHVTLEGCIRVSVGNREANDAFLAAAGLATN